MPGTNRTSASWTSTVKFQGAVRAAPRSLATMGVASVTVALCFLAVLFSSVSGCFVLISMYSWRILWLRVSTFADSSGPSFSPVLVCCLQYL